MTEQNPFLVHRCVKGLSNAFTMPQGTKNHEFQTKADQMRYWLTDPILRPEAIQWFENAGYQPVLDETGYAIDYTLAVDVEVQAEARRLRHAS